LLQTLKQDISYHVKQIYKSGQLEENSTVKEILTVQKKDSRNNSRGL